MFHVYNVISYVFSIYFKVFSQSNHIVIDFTYRHRTYIGHLFHFLYALSYDEEKMLICSTVFFSHCPFFSENILLDLKNSIQDFTFQVIISAAFAVDSFFLLR